MKKTPPTKPKRRRMSWRNYRRARAINASTITDWLEHPLNARDTLAQGRGNGSGDDTGTPAMLEGRLIHAATFEPWTIKREFRVRPLTYAGPKGEVKTWNSNATACKAWLEQNTDKDVITFEQLARARKYARAVRKHPHFRELIREDGNREFSVVVRDPETGLELKSRFDYIDGDKIVDLKTMADARPGEMEKACFRLNYHVKAAFYMHVARLAGFDVRAFYIVALEKCDPPRIAVRQFDDLALMIGDQTWRQALPELARCIETDEWPGYTGDTIEPLSLPQFAIKQFNQTLNLEGAETV